LVLAGSATISNSPNIVVSETAALNVSGLAAGHLPLSNQVFTIEGTVEGHVMASNNSEVHLNSATSTVDNVTLTSGSLAAGTGTITGSLQVNGGLVRVGSAGLPGNSVPTTLVVDDFNDGDLAEYTKSIVNDGNVGTANVTLSGASTALAATYAGTATHEQLVILRDDVSLQVGETLVVDVDMNFTSLQMDFGLAVSETAIPATATEADSDTRDTFEWASVAVRPSQNNIRVNQSVNGSLNTMDR
jgi:hypothetical protein